MRHKCTKACNEWNTPEYLAHVNHLVNRYIKEQKKQMNGFLLGKVKDKNLKGCTAIQRRMIDSCWYHAKHGESKGSGGSYASDYDYLCTKDGLTLTASVFSHCSGSDQLSFKIIQGTTMDVKTKKILGKVLFHAHVDANMSDAVVRVEIETDLERGKVLKFLGIK